MSLRAAVTIDAVGGELLYCLIKAWREPLNRWQFENKDSVFHQTHYNLVELIVQVTIPTMWGTSVIPNISHPKIEFPALRTIIHTVQRPLGECGVIMQCNSIYHRSINDPNMLPLLHCDIARSLAAVSWVDQPAVDD